MDACYRIFGLHGGDGSGGCGCGNPECQAAYKHPIASNWQHTPEWSEEQIEVMEEMGQLDTGYGVIVKACWSWTSTRATAGLNPTGA